MYVDKSPAAGRREKPRYVLDLSGFQKDEKGKYLLGGRQYRQYLEFP